MLATKGPLPLAAIVQATSPLLNARTVKEALFVLIHHNLVQYRPAVAMGDSITQPVIYHLSRDRALLRLALPLLIRSIYIKYRGEEEHKVRAIVDLLRDVIKQGRLQLTEKHDATAVSDLFSAGFIELVTPTDSLYDEATEGGGEVGALSVESSSPARKRPRTVAVSATTSSTSSPARKRARRSAKASSNTPRITDYVRWSLACLAHIWEEYLVEYARIMVNPAAGAVMQAILQVIGGHDGGGGKEDIFGTFQVSTRLSPLTSLPVEGEEKRTGGMGKSAVAEYLECMVQDIQFITKEDTRNGGLYRLSTRMALRTLRLRCIESFIRARFGQPSARIWRILMDKQFLEEKIISKIAMITPKEARERLYGLLRMGLLALQEVPKTLDHAPSRTFYLWHIREDAAYASMAGALERTLGNALARMRWEREQHRTIIAKSERSDVAANPSLLAPGEQQQLHILRRTLDRLLLQQTRLARELLLFDQFLVE